MTTIKTKTIVLLFVLFSFFLGNPIGFAQTPDCNSPTAKYSMRSNNVDASIYNIGSLFIDPVSLSSGYEIPKGSGNHSMYTIGLWMGARDSGGNLKFAAATYGVNGNDFWAGPIDETQPMGGLTPDICSQYDRLFSVTGSDINKFKADVEANGTPFPSTLIPTSILRWPARNTAYFQDFNLPINRDLAPFWDADGDNVYDPTKGDYPVIDSSLPDFIPTEMTWWIMNDIGGEHDLSGGESLGAEISCLAYSFTSGVEAVNNTTFYKYKIRAAQRTFRDFYVGLYVDSDLGQFDDDYLGCIPELNTGFFYNADSFDGSYGSTPPLIGVRFLNGLVNNAGEDLGMSSFIDMELNDGPRGFPSEPIGFYRYLQGIWNDGTPLTKGGNGYGGSEVTTFAYDGDPSNPAEWSECSVNNVPFDRRFVMSSGPVELKVSQTQEIDFAIYWTRPQNAYPCPSSGHLQLVIDEVESLSNTIVNIPAVLKENIEISVFSQSFLRVYQSSIPPTSTFQSICQDIQYFRYVGS